MTLSPIFERKMIFKKLKPHKYPKQSVAHEEPAENKTQEHK